MKYAEYYIKQNALSLNIEINILAKSFVNDLQISKNLLNYIKASVIVEKIKDFLDFHLYKIQLQLIYTNSSNDNNVICLKKNTNNATSSNIFSSVKNVNDRESFFCPEGLKFNCKNYSLKSKLNNFVHNENSDANSSSSNKIICTNISEERILNTNESIRLNKLNFLVKTELKESEGENEGGKKNIAVEFTSNNTLFINGSNSKHNVDKSKIELQKLRKSRNESDYFEISHLLRGKDLCTKDVCIFQQKHLCRYIFLPSILSVQKARIKTIHFLLQKKLSIILLLDIVVNRKNNSFFELSANIELDNMLKLKKNIIILCRSCNSNIIMCSKINLIMPHLYLRTPNFFDHAFCEECTSFSYDSVNDVDNNIFVLSNSLCFNFGLIKDSKLIVRKNAIGNYRYFFFCNFCFSPLGYLENENNKTFFSYIDNKNINDSLKIFLFDFMHQTDKQEYTKLDKILFINRNNKTVKISKKDGQQIVSYNTECLNSIKLKKEKSLLKGGLLAHNVVDLEKGYYNAYSECSNKGEKDVKHENCEDTEYNNTRSSDLDNVINICNNPKVYLFKHKIKMQMNKKNIFKNYNDLLFLNEYMHNKCEKYKTVVFYLKNDQKRKIIEIRIFIKKLYICKILDVENNCENSAFFQKAIKVLYCTKEEKDIKFANSEVIIVSKEIYEDLLKMLINYSFELGSWLSKKKKKNE
ncbi:conserved Plasmodium protein, unknown function [Plasmodium malariae]|uniref:Uncharacterized protein n=1 Tax=Plasmodium malariae TaxID=5858 RepID=A0A1C3L138_PLAMA|nr:conserved Plasmodium protein, unknown function [Plasmodium malariae]